MQITTAPQSQSGFAYLVWAYVTGILLVSICTHISEQVSLPFDSLMNIADGIGFEVRDIFGVNAKAQF